MPDEPRESPLCDTKLATLGARSIRPAMSNLCSSRWARVVLLGLLLLVLGLQVLAMVNQSLTGDGAYHLVAGYQALRYGQNRINLEHPPLVKLLAALPALADQPALAEPVDATEALDAADEIHRQPNLVWRATLKGRAMILAAVVLPLLVACYGLGRRAGDWCTGVLMVALFGLSFSVVPLLTILQTDAAVTLGACATVLALWRWQGEPEARWAVAAGACWGLALSSKFSGVLLAPAILAAFLVPARSVSRWRRFRDLGIAGLVAVSALYLVYSTANWDYDSRVGRRTIGSYVEGEGSLVVGEALKPWEEELLALEEVSPAFSQWAVGFLGVRAQNRLGVYPSYAFGEVRSEGRWWYFPVLFVVKMPLVLLVAMAAAAPKTRELVRTLGWPRLLPAVLFVVLYLGVAIVSNYNLGFRHLLPVLPFLLVPVAFAARRWRRRTWVLLGALALESILLTPTWMAATNTWWLGESNPTRFAFSAGNLEYRQSFVQLARWARRNEIEDLKVFYPLLAEEVLRAYVPDARVVEPGTPVTPGWYAVSTVVEQYVPSILTASPNTLYGHQGLDRLARRWLPFWQEVVRRGDDRGYVAGTFHIYLVDHDPGPTAAPREPRTP